MVDEGGVESNYSGKVRHNSGVERTRPKINSTRTLSYKQTKMGGKVEERFISLNIVSSGFSVLENNDYYFALFYTPVKC